MGQFWKLMKAGRDCSIEEILREVECLQTSQTEERLKMEGTRNEEAAEVESNDLTCERIASYAFP